MIDVVVVRDPDFSNEISVYGDDNANIVDIDVGRDDLHDEEEWNEWQDGLKAACLRCSYRDAQKAIKNTVTTYAEVFDHPVPKWAQS